jgi:hypothetical protein
MSDQSVFGKKVKKKDGGAGGLMVLGIIGVAAAVIAALTAVMFMS